MRYAFAASAAFAYLYVSRHKSIFPFHVWGQFDIIRYRRWHSPPQKKFDRGFVFAFLCASRHAHLLGITGIIYYRHYWSRKRFYARGRRFLAAG